MAPAGPHRVEVTWRRRGVTSKVLPRSKACKKTAVLQIAKFELLCLYAAYAVARPPNFGVWEITCGTLGRAKTKKQNARIQARTGDLQVMNLTLWPTELCRLVTQKR